MQQSYGSTGVTERTPLGAGSNEQDGVEDGEEEEHQPIERQASLPLPPAKRNVLFKQVQKEWVDQLPIGLFFCCSMFIVMPTLWLWTTWCAFWHGLALFNNVSKPCDQPLKFYLPLVCAAAVVRLTVLWKVFRVNDRRFLASVAVAWPVVGWGVWMVSSAETCPKTNPDLFISAEALIHAQIVCTVLEVLISMILEVQDACLERRTSFQYTYPGHSYVVQSMPVVDLTVTQKGMMLECSICGEPVDGTAKVVVHTPCDNLFHERCLSLWAGSHTDCPMCRRLLL